MSHRADTAPAPTRSRIDDCWNTIGVRGDASCPQLPVHVHCRNCPIYAAAALEVLDRDLPSNYAAEWTSHFAQTTAAEDLHTDPVVVFRVGAEWLALSTRVIKEVADLRPIHSLPHRRSGGVLGVANVRGELLVCVSVGQLLGVEQGEESRHEQRGVHQRFLVIQHEGHRAVLPVDEVHGIHRVHARELRDVPATVARATATCTKAILLWNGKSVGLLDEQLLLFLLSRSLA